MNLVWTPTALREFEAAFHEMSRHRPAAAISWREDVLMMRQMIENHPAMGHHHRTASEGEYREVIVGRYRFIYRLTADILEMRRILHVRRDYDPQRIREGPRPGFPAFAS